MHLPTTEQYLHKVNTMLLELDLRMLLYFLSKTMFELLYILQNWPLSPHCAIMWFFRWLCDRMWQEVNLCKIAPAHNIRSPVVSANFITKIISYISSKLHLCYCWFEQYPKKNITVFFSWPKKNPGIFHKPPKIPFGQNFRPKKIPRNPLCVRGWHS